MKPDPSIDEPFLVEEPGGAGRRPSGAPRREADTAVRRKGLDEDFYVEGEAEAAVRYQDGVAAESSLRQQADTPAEGGREIADDPPAGSENRLAAGPAVRMGAGVSGDAGPEAAGGDAARSAAAVQGNGNDSDVTPPARKRPKAAGVNGVLTGDILSHSGLRRWYPFILYCVGLVFVYITHVFYIHRLETTRIREEMELNALRQKSLVYSADRMNATRQSRILEQVRQRGLGLQESLVPPKVIEP